MSSFPFALLFFAAAAYAAPALAIQPKPIARSGEFLAYRYEENGSPVCYVVSRPDRSTGEHTKRGEAYLLVTHRPAQGTRNVISVKFGYAYKPGSEVTLKIGDKSFALFTKDDTVWARDQATDNAIVSAIRTGLTMTAGGISDRDMRTVETYNIEGSNRALNVIDRACRDGNRRRR